MALVFSAANINTVKTSSAVKNISMKTPCAMDVPLVRVVVNAGLPGNMHRTRAAACTFLNQHGFLGLTRTSDKIGLNVEQGFNGRTGAATDHNAPQHLSWEQERTPKLWEGSCDASFSTA